MFVNKILFPLLMPGGGHFHITSDMDVQQTRVWLFILKSAKGVTFRLPRSQTSVKSCFFYQITEILRSFLNNAKIYSQKFIFGRFRVYIFEHFLPFACEGSKILPKFWSGKGKGLKVPDTHLYPRLYRSPPPATNATVSLETIL